MLGKILLVGVVGVFASFLLFLATLADASAAGDAVPTGVRIDRGDRPSRGSEVLVHRGQVGRPGEQTMPALLDVFSRAGVAVQASVMTAGIWVLEAPLNPSGAARTHARHVTPRWDYVFRDRIGSH